MPIVAVTASCMTEQCQGHVESAMDRVLRKPSSVREFGALLEHDQPAMHAGAEIEGSGNDGTEVIDVACAGSR